ncbi:MAG TPA: aminoglycoside adenylyltransferase domain-containing protein [Ktedonobacteraceae bacterium]|nr:aminoglycoside adenylyltransferase domain-containing protein [Ktedonobacteraceae bacterium]
MAQYNWSSCPDPVREQVQAFCEQMRGILGNELVAIYLHGSLAMGCFNPDRSDFDLLVIIQHQLPIETQRQIMEALLEISNAPCPIETSFLVAPELHPFQHPLPYHLHYSESWRQKMSDELANGSWRRWNEVQRYDPDLSAHLTIIHHRGITLYGPAATDILPQVPAEHYIKSIVGDYIDARELCKHFPVYFILNACRVHAYLNGQQILSKDEGGVYGLKTLPAEFHDLISQALEMYRGQRPDTPFDESMLASLANYMDDFFKMVVP